MDLTDHDIQQILALVERAEYDTIDLEWKGLRLRLSRGGHVEKTAAFSVDQQNVSYDNNIHTHVDQSTSTPTPAPSNPTAATVQTAGPAESPKAIIRNVPEAWVTVRAPTMGSFYQSPEPGAEPFVLEGTRVNEEDSLALIEVMKVYSAVTAPISGTIRQVLVEDNALVEFDQPLFVIEPDA